MSDADAQTDAGAFVKSLKKEVVQKAGDGFISEMLAELEAPAAESADHVTYERNAGKRRGEFVFKSVFMQENPKVNMSGVATEWRQSKDKSRLLECVKVYKAKEDEKIVFSDEEEGEEVRHITEIDNGTVLLLRDR